MKYTEFPYKRIDIENSKSDIADIVSRLSKSNNSTEQIKSIMEMDTIMREYSSYEAIASLNFSRNINDPSAKSEKEYYDSISPEITEQIDSFNKVLDQSKHKRAINKEFGETYLKQIELSLKTFDPKIKDMLKDEINLKNEYEKLTAGAKIQYNGENYNLAGLGSFHLDSSRAIRKSSYKARFKWFSDNSDKLDLIYDKLVKLRHKIAIELGYDNFIELGYMRMGRYDYGPEDVKNFRKQIIEHVVPYCKILSENKREILGLDHVYFYDGINFLEGDPKPKGTPDELVKHAQRMYRELSPETGEFFDMMVREDLMDLVTRDGKSPGGFCTSFPKYLRPYIFSNFNGTDHDITVLTHEAGHAFQNYSSRKQPLMNYHWPTMESAEIHSMSMELFTWPWMDLFFKEETERFKYKHISSNLSFLPYGACVDHFQHWVYENHSATPKERNEKWLELESIYMPQRDYDDLDFPKSGGIWQGQLHIYRFPFYYIDYTLAQTCAFQFWINSQNDKEESWQNYLKLCEAGGSLSFTNLIKLAGLRSPFVDGCLEDVVGNIKNWLDNIDLKKL